MPNIRPLPPCLQQVARDELNEVPERIESDLQALKDWIQKQRHLNARTDDQFLVAFLRSSKYSLERAKQKLDKYYTVRTALTELFTNRDPLDPKNAEIIKLGVGVALPLPEGEKCPRVVLIRPGIYSADKITIQDVMRISVMQNDIMLLEDDNFIVAGQVGILDLANVGKSHLLQMQPSFIKKMTVLSQDASPFRLKGFHYVNTPTGFETVLNIFKSFMNEKNRNRIHVHGNDVEALYTAIGRKYLPTEYGGDAGPLQDIITYWEKKLIEYRDYFLEEAKHMNNEKLRIGRPETADSLFGVEGSFRQLNVD